MRPVYAVLDTSSLTSCYSLPATDLLLQRIQAGVPAIWVRLATGSLAAHGNDALSKGPDAFARQIALGLRFWAPTPFS